MYIIMLLLRANSSRPALLDQLGARLLHTESLGHVHMAGGDYNASIPLP